MPSDLKFVVVGAGGRGMMFSDWILKNVGKGAVVGVADPRPERRQLAIESHGIPPEGVFASWQEMIDAPRVADIMINATMDRDHAPSCIAAMRAGYHLMMEKPMGVTLQEAAAIDAVRRYTGRLANVCHSLRYHSVSTELRRILRDGVIGEIVHVEHVERVNLLHHAHSYVRGNWGVEAESAPMLLAKSCHDIDLITFLINRPCIQVASFGSLKNFKAENAPPGAPDYCVQGCPVGDSCPFNAVDIYGGDSWLVEDALLKHLRKEERLKALATSRYGRCAYLCSNDVVDHQVVALEYEGGITATFTMSAFNAGGGRFTRIEGTKGSIEVDLDACTIDLTEFWRGNAKMRLTPKQEGGSHGGEDLVMRTLIGAVESGDPGKLLTGTEESLRSHAIVFAAERSRRQNRVVTLRELEDDIIRAGQESIGWAIDGLPSTSGKDALQPARDMQ